LSDTAVSDAAPSYLDGLFATLMRLGIDTALEPGAQALLESFTETFDHVAAGVSIATGDTQLVVRRSPHQDVAHVQDPVRLFAELGHEWIVDLGKGSTLHVAAEDPARLAEARVPADRLSMALRFLIERTTALDALRNTRRESEELRLQVIHSEKLASLGQIAAGIVHELNNPLTSILAYSDYLRREWQRRGMDAADTERLRRIYEAADRILAFTRDLIAYSRPSASVPGPVDIREVLERALLFCEHVIATHKVLVERAFGNTRLITGVSGQLTQVFVNLITNAAQAMSKSGGRLLISLQMNEDQRFVVVRVADEGHGIREEHQARLFEPYFTTKSDGTGTGLGLPIVLNIVKGHGGTIRAENHECGAVFVVELPVAAGSSLDD